jgi:hypothetical protein
LNMLTPDDVKAETTQYTARPFLRLDDEAAEHFLEWRVDLEARLRTGEMSPALESHLGKYRTLLPALALINHLADGGTGPVSDIAVTRAQCFCSYLESHARRAYASGQEIETAVANAIVRRIKRGDIVDGFTARDIRRNQWSGLSDTDQIKAGLDLLTDLNWVAPFQIPTAGRYKNVYSINPEACR